MLVLVFKLILYKGHSYVKSNSLNEKLNSWFLFTFRQDQQVPHVPAVYQVPHVPAVYQVLHVVPLVIWYIMINQVPQKWEWEDPLVTVVILTHSKTVHSRLIFQNITHQNLVILDEQVGTYYMPKICPDKYKLLQVKFFCTITELAWK